MHTVEYLHNGKTRHENNKHATAAGARHLHDRPAAA
jgi:hypothetical protein